MLREIHERLRRHQLRLLRKLTPGWYRRRWFRKALAVARITWQSIHEIYPEAAIHLLYFRTYLFRDRVAVGVAWLNEPEEDRGYCLQECVITGASESGHQR